MTRFRLMSRPMTAPRRKGRGVLGVISGILVASAAIRLMDGTGAALAEAAAETASAIEGTDTAAFETDCLTGPETDAILAALSEREGRVTTKEHQIEDRLQALSVAEAEITRRLEELRSAEEALGATLSIASTASEGDLSNLTTVYESMKPADAAALFEQMPPEFAAGFLGRMRPDAAALIFAGLAPETAYAISVSLAGRNALAPSK